MTPPAREALLRRLRLASAGVALVLLLLALSAAGRSIGAAAADRGISGAAALLAAAVVLGAVAKVSGRLLRRVPKGSVLLLELGEPLRDTAATGLLGPVVRRLRPTLRDVVEALEHAADDPRVAGLVMRIGVPPRGLADVQELRDAIGALRERGKLTIAHADTFGELGEGTRPYYLASACEEIHLQPSGEVGLTGIAMEVPFLRGLLDRLGIEPQVDHRRQYKTASNAVTETGFTDAHREAAQGLVASLGDQVMTGVAAGRGVPAAEVRERVDAGPMPAGDALEEGLVDRLAYRDETTATVRERVRRDDALLDLRQYRPPRRQRRGEVLVAAVHGSGVITRGADRLHPLSGRSMGAETIVTALRAAAEDRRVKAVLLRVDSRGGSYIASDTIRREIACVRERGKPVVVSMGNVAASGGYFLALAADRIVAHPATLTGSIGVVAGKMVLAEAQERLGVVVEEVHEGAHALLGSASRPYDEEQWEVVQRFLDRVYADFVAKVAEARGLEERRVEELAQGRVWSGEQAAERGLVDGLGGYPTALQCVREVLGLDADAPLRLATVPRPTALSGVRQTMGSGIALLGDGVDLPRSGSEGLTRLLGLAEQGALRMPPGLAVHRG